MDMTYYETTDFGMGTIIEQKVAVESTNEGEIVCQDISNLIKDLEGKMSYFIPESFVSQLNSSNGHFIKIDPDTFCVLKTAKKYFELSGGSFDMTVAPLSALWRDSIHNKTLPSEDTIQDLIKVVSGTDMILDEKNSLAKINKCQSIDLGGIGKGYAADIALKAYKERGIKSAFINLGGNVHTLGEKTNGEPWMVGIQDPRHVRGINIAALRICDRSVVTSGDYEKYFEMGNKRYHHIIDPKTGYPANSDLISATVVSPSSMEADALSTAVFILGLEEGMELIEKIPGAEGVLITKDNNVFITRGLKECLIAFRDAQDYKFYLYN